MKFSAGLRLLGLLRRIAVALEGIREEFRYGNERAFPPAHVRNGGKLKTVLHGKKREEPEGWNG